MTKPKKKPSMGMLGKKHSDVSRQRISEKLKGISKNTGASHPRAKTANIYNVDTGEMIAQDVCLKPWCRENGYPTTPMALVARGEKEQYRGLKATYNEMS